MKKIISIIFFSLLVQCCLAQSWIQVNNNPNTKSGRTRNKAFAINGTGYVLGGSDDYNYYGSEAWAYDTATQSWSAIAPYPDANGDDGKSAVTVDTLGYAGLGGTGGFLFTNSWFSYSPAKNKWDTLTPFPGAARAYSATFTIAGEIYVAGGLSGAADGYDNFWKYDPPTDTWTYMGTCPAMGVNFSAVAFTINGNGYVGTGALADSMAGTLTAQQDFWQYDPSNNSWTQLAPFPGGPRTEAMGWATCDKGYIGGGYEVHTPQTIDSDFWQYDPASNAWTPIANYGGGNLNGAATFVIGQTGYVCGGQRDSANYQQARGYTWTNDVWSYTAIYTPSFTTTDSTICSGQTITFNDNSNYTPTHWQWNFTGGKPDASTSPNPVVKYDSSGTYNVVLTAWNDCDSGSKIFANYIVVGVGPVLAVLPDSPSVCNGQIIKLTASGGNSYQWVSTTDTTDSITVTPAKDTTYELLAMSSSGCTTDTFISVNVTNAPPLAIQPPSTFICPGTTIVLTVPVSGSNYMWSPVLTLSSSTGDSVTAKPSSQTIYTVTGTDSLGCSVTASDTISISIAPNKPTITTYKNDLISSATQGNQWVRNDTAITGATNQTYTVNIGGYYQVIASNPANGCSTESDSSFATGVNQLSVNSNQLTVYPNPTGGEINVTVSSSAMDVGDWNLQVTDVLGRTLLTKQSLNYNNEIDLSDLSSGVYFITVISKTGRVAVPVVKQ